MLEDEYRRRTRRRDLARAASDILLVGLYVWAMVSPVSWPVRAGALVVALAAVVDVWRSLRLRLAPPPSKGSGAADGVDGARLRALDRRLHYHGSRPTWYLAPLAIGGLSFVLGAAESAWAALLGVAGLALALAGARHLERRFVDETLRPRRRRLDGGAEEAASS
ncbi:MAG TPA: hypothetical protein VKA44_02700 [Gemmatimonadota bacterium]|nr:hypothetical protein [Gemmatimonadota bacterium]